MKKSTTGFTIVELLVVIAVIGILTTITIVGFTRYQMNNRDTEREAKTTVLAEALEKYYDNNGEYPGCKAITTADTALISKDILSGIESKTYLTPKSPTGNTNSIECTDITGATGEADVFAYVGDASATCQNGNACLRYRLKYKEESTGQIITLNSRRNVNVSSSDAPTLTVMGTGFYQIDTNWNSVDSAESYILDIATDSGFTVNHTTRTYATSGTNVITSLLYGTTYYFRVQAVFATGDNAAWSTVKTASTWSLAKPTVTVGTETTTTVPFSWASVPYATSYAYQHRINGGAWSAVQSTTGTSVTITSSNGATVDLQARSVAAIGTSAWSSIATGYLIPGTPTASVGAVTTTTATYNWTTVTNAARYESQYRINGGAWSGTINELTNTSRTHSPTTQGSKIDFQARAVNAGGAAGGWSAAVNATLGINVPIWNSWGRTSNFPNIDTWVYNAGGSALCPAGTSIYTQFRDGIHGSFWNGWSAYGSNGASSETLKYTSVIGDYSTTLQTQIQGYCRNEASGVNSTVIATGESTYVHPTPPSATLSGASSCVQAYNVRPMFDVVLTLQETSMNLNANTSVVTWTAYRRASGNTYHTWNTQFEAEDKHSATVNGTSVYSGPSASKRFFNAYSVWATEALYQTGTANSDSVDSGSINIAHSADGTKTISGSVSDTFGGQVFGAASCSLNYTLSDLR